MTAARKHGGTVILRQPNDMGQLWSPAIRGQDLTRHLLAFGRRQRLNPAPVSLASLAVNLRRLLGSSLGASVEITGDCPDDLWTVEVDVNEWELAILNMAVNSRDAMPTGGRLIIKTRNVSLPADDVDMDLSGDFVELTVSDTGAGIPADILPKVVEPFFTTKAVPGRPRAPGRSPVQWGAIGCYSIGCREGWPGALCC